MGATGCNKLLLNQKSESVLIYYFYWLVSCILCKAEVGPVRCGWTKNLWRTFQPLCDSATIPSITDDGLHSALTSTSSITLIFSG